MASSSNCGVPGLIRMPLWGKATSWMSIRPLYSSRTRKIVSSDFRPTEPSTMTWLRICVVPWPMQRSSWLRARTSIGAASAMFWAWKRHAFMHVEPVGAWLVRAPGIAIEAGVEMDVAFDEAGNDEGVAEVDGLVRGGRLIDGRDRGDAAVRDGDVMPGSAVEARVQEDRVEGHPVPPLVDCDDHRASCG